MPQKKDKKKGRKRDSDDWYVLNYIVTDYEIFENYIAYPSLAFKFIFNSVIDLSCKHIYFLITFFHHDS